MGIAPEQDTDHFHEECGVFGIFGIKDAAAHVALGLHALQHRGQEAAGIISRGKTLFHAHRALGLVGDTFNKPKIIKKLKGNAAIGHNRYSTSGEPSLRNVQPLFAEYHFGGMALAHNGNLTNAYHLRQKLKEKGCIFQSTSDTEAIVHLVAMSDKPTMSERLIDALCQVEGAYSLVALGEKAMIAVRDPYGVRPLVLGKLHDAYVVASESCALDIIGAEYLRDVDAGEMIIVTRKGMTSLRPFETVPPKFCIFEYVYFARPDSNMQGVNVYEARKQIGRELARENGVAADIVVPVPDSGVPAAIGYAEGSGIPFDLGIIRNHYVGRTFIEPTSQIRNLGVKLKHNANVRSLAGKRVVLVDDSIVRGTTSRKIVAMVRAAGASEVHMRIASPPSTHSCYYGVDTPEREDLLASFMNVEEMAEHIDADSLAFLSLDGLYRASGESRRNGHEPQFCDACFTGDYPVPLRDRDDKLNHHGNGVMHSINEV